MHIILVGKYQLAPYFLLKKQNSPAMKIMLEKKLKIVISQIMEFSTLRIKRGKRNKT